MAPPPARDWTRVHRRREAGEPWASIARDHGISASSLRGGYSRWRKRTEDTPGASPTAEAGDKPRGVDEATAAAPSPGRQRDGSVVLDTTISKEDIGRITTLEELMVFFDVDEDEWEIAECWINGNSWEQHSVAKGVVVLHQYQVKARLVRKVEARLEEAERVLDQLVEDAATHAPDYRKPEFTPLIGGDPVVLVVNIYDPHLGMLAWGKEVGQDYDLSIGVADYARAAERLLAFSHIYPTAHILFVVGHDFLHVDGPAMDPRGGTRGGATSAGTMQDIDSRLPKMFTAGRRALVRAIDKARLIAPTEVMVVPGNHDGQQMYRMGEVLNAWYRNDSAVEVRYGPKKRKFWGWGKNTLMLTHGEEYKRKRDPLPLIMATECPADLWVASEDGCREILTGHNHVNMQGKYHPTSEVDETRAIRTRSLAGLTPEDSWHYLSGYKHRRAATVIAYRKSGGVAGLHEHTP